MRMYATLRHATPCRCNAVLGTCHPGTMPYVDKCVRISTCGRDKETAYCTVKYVHTTYVLAPVTHLSGVLQPRFAYLNNRHSYQRHHHSPQPEISPPLVHIFRTPARARRPTSAASRKSIVCGEQGTRGLVSLTAWNYVVNQRRINRV